jgi:hypothetical protein
MTYHFRLACRSADVQEHRAELASGRHDPLGADRTLRVLGVRDDDADQPPALVVEDLREQGRISEG